MMRRITLLATAIVLALVAALPATAQTEEPERSVTWHYDDETGALSFGYGEEDLDCAPVEEAEGEAEEALSEETEATEEESLLIVDNCATISVEGPQGQTNHGTVMSSVVKAIKNSDYEGPLGQIVREFAKSDLGKDGEEEGETEEVEPAGKGKPESPGKSGNKGNNGNNGRGKGPKG